MQTTTSITIGHGDGIGPEIMDATLRILEAAGANLEYETIEIGEGVYRRGVTSGIEDSAWASLRRTKVFLKAPITTPQGGGYKSLNVTIRKTLGLYANVRPCVSYHPFIDTRHPGMDIVIIRENEEDLYAGIEHRQTDQVVQCLKLITRPGCEKIVRYAFEYAKRNNRKKVTCFTKDNIMKLTDGLFHKVFDEIAAEYPSIASDHFIVDIGTARLADDPCQFDVIVTPNLYGDVISDVAAEIAGSVGLAGSANVGEHVSMFEAIHGSAPAIAGQGIANPSGLILASVMMLVHLGKSQAAAKVHNALLATLEDGIHTADIYAEGVSRRKVGTSEFTAAVIERLGREPRTLAPATYPDQATPITASLKPRPRAAKKVVGVDMFLDWDTGDPEQLAAIVRSIETDKLSLSMITNRGVKVWPQGAPETFCTDHWRCRFTATNGGETAHRDVVDLLHRATNAGLDFIKTEHLCTFDGEPGFSLGQGQ